MCGKDSSWGNLNIAHFSIPPHLLRENWSHRQHWSLQICWSPLPSSPGLEIAVWSIFLSPPNEAWKVSGNQMLTKQISCNEPGLLTRCSATPRRQRPLRICAAGPSGRITWKNRRPLHFLAKQNWNHPPWKGSSIATQGFPFMIWFSFKIKLYSIFSFSPSPLVSCIIDFFEIFPLKLLYFNNIF